MISDYIQYYTNCSLYLTMANRNWHYLYAKTTASFWIKYKIIHKMFKIKINQIRNLDDLVSFIRIVDIWIFYWTLLKFLGATLYNVFVDSIPNFMLLTK